MLAPDSTAAAAARALQVVTPAWLGGVAPPGVGAAMSCRGGGASAGRYAGLNLGVAVGDDPSAVAENRRRWAALIGARPVWLRQVHGASVVELTAVRADADADLPADAGWTRERGVACTVQVADCLPVLLALRDGSAVAAAHAGWRGLAGGIVENTVAVICAGSGASPGDLMAWLGPCIGPRRFEVGADVLDAFGADPGGGPQRHFAPQRRAADGALRWLADLRGLARDRLAAAGVTAVATSADCTVEQPDRHYSHRRDGVTGRAAASIWLY